VFGIHHIRAKGIQFYSDIAHQGLYEKLKQFTITSFRDRQINLRDLPWHRTVDESHYLEKNVQEYLLNFQFEDNDDGIIKNMGEVYEYLYHEVINEISPPNAYITM
jgi:hypothetical protein